MIICKVCNKELDCINSQHLKQHDMTTVDYRAIYPDSPFKSEEIRQKSGESNKRTWAKNPERKAKFIHYLKTRISPLKGTTHISYTKGKKLNLTPEGLAKLKQMGKELGLLHIKNLHTPEIKAKRADTLKKKLTGKSYEEIYGQDAERLKKDRKRCFDWIWAEKDECTRNYLIRKSRLSLNIRPNKPEQYLNDLLNLLFPDEWKYVGNGEVIIGGFNPDFININGKKLICELYGIYWHGHKITQRTKEQEEKRKIDVYAKYGYRTLVVWEYELKEIEKLKDRLINFCKQEKKF